jgi:hypothetical protein
MTLPISPFAATWNDLGAALWDVPDTELAELVAKLTSDAAASPGRAGAVLLGFAGVAEAERGRREREDAHRRSAATRGR